MSYYANFINNSDQLINITILVPNSSTDTELVLAGEPVIITQESEGLFAPIKSQSCTISIMTDSALWDLYTTDPQAILVNVGNKTTGKTLFIGYATPCQYGQDWTSLDVLSLECVDMLSSLKAIPYHIRSTSPAYIPVDELISYLLAMTIGDYDQMYHSYAWFWPKYNFSQANGNDLASTSDLLHAIKLNESNFFDDDEEHTPWTCYEVLEEICRFMNVTAVPFEGAVWFIDYFYAASNYWSHTYYDFWQYSLDMDVEAARRSKPLTITKTQYAAGTTSIGTDDFYNIINVNANRYDIDEIATDLMDEKYHVSITKECDFGGQEQQWTITEEHGWWLWATTSTTTYNIYKNYCRLSGLYQGDPKPWSGWTHKWYIANDLGQGSTVVAWPNYHSTWAENQTAFKNTPENKWINNIGAEILHYATFEDTFKKPSKLDWKDCIMFQCMTDTIEPASTNTRGYYQMTDICPDRNEFEQPVLEYETDFNLNYSPKDGISWLVLNGSMFYQQNYCIRPGSANINDYITPTKLAPTNIQTMFPIEDVTDWDAYIASTMAVDVAGNKKFQRKKSDPQYGQGWKLLQMKLQIGDKYWNGSAWTTTESTFYLSFSAECDGDAYKYNGESIKTYDSFAMLKWMNIVDNTTYQSKLGTDGYCIPITSNDAVSGKAKITLYTPRQVPAGIWTGSATEWGFWYNNSAGGSSNAGKYGHAYWYSHAPIVFMKDFKIEYAYTDETEWWLNKDVETDDIKYSNETEDNYKYEKDETMRINSWQEGRPIAKSFPIIDFTSGSTHTYEYFETMSDPTYYAAEERAQEMNVVNRQLRHYEEPRKKVDVNRHNMMVPWQRVLFDLNTSGLSGTYVVDSQEIDVKNNVITSHLVEYGDTTIYSKE